MNTLGRLKEAVNWISELFTKIPAHIKDYAAQAIIISDKIKADMQSNTAVIITELIPGDWDDNLRNEAIVLLTFLHDVLEAIADIDTTQSIAKNAIYAKIGAQLIALQDGKVLSENVYDTYFQNVYSKTKIL